MLLPHHWQTDHRKLWPLVCSRSMDPLDSIMQPRARQLSQNSQKPRSQLHKDTTYTAAVMNWKRHLLAMGIQCIEDPALNPSSLRRM